MADCVLPPKGCVCSQLTNSSSLVPPSTRQKRPGTLGLFDGVARPQMWSPSLACLGLGPATGDAIDTSIRYSCTPSRASTLHTVGPLINFTFSSASALQNALQGCLQCTGPEDAGAVPQRVLPRVPAATAICLGPSRGHDKLQMICTSSFCFSRGDGLETYGMHVEVYSAGRRQEWICAVAVAGGRRQHPRLQGSAPWVPVSLDDTSCSVLRC